MPADSTNTEPFETWTLVFHTEPLPSRPALVIRISGATQANHPAFRVHSVVSWQATPSVGRTKTDT